MVYIFIARIKSDHVDVNFRLEILGIYFSEKNATLAINEYLKVDTKSIGFVELIKYPIDEPKADSIKDFCEEYGDENIGEYLFSLGTQINIF